MGMHGFAASHSEVRLGTYHKALATVTCLCFCSAAALSLTHRRPPPSLAGAEWIGDIEPRWSTKDIGAGLGGKIGYDAYLHKAVQEPLERKALADMTTAEGEAAEASQLLSRGMASQ